MQGSRHLLLVALVAAMVGCRADGGPIREAIQARRAAAAEDPETAAQFEGGMGRLKGEVRLPAGAQLLRDLPYGSDPQQKLDVYVPAGARAAPIIMMVHGGGWIRGDKAYLPVVEAKVARWLPKGYIVVSINYRLSSSPRVMDQADDVARALAHVQANAAKWGGDGSRLLLMGHSAGAHLATLVAAAPSIRARHGVRPWLGTVSLDSAVVDVVETMESRHHRRYDDVFGSDRRFWEAASPFHQLSAKPAPVLLVCSSRRRDACPQAEAFAAKVRSFGGRATVMPVELRHGPINTELGATSDYTAKFEQFMHELGLP